MVSLNKNDTVMRLFLPALLILALAAAPGAAVLLPVGPDCLTEEGRNAPFREEPITIESQGYELAGTLYLPEAEGRYPALALMHGGGSNIEILRITPRFFAQMLVRCGFVVITWDKHGLGDSGGDYATSTFDDFVNDAGAATKLLARHPEVDDTRIGVLGFSQGGRLAPVTAHRHEWVSFAGSVSGPIAGVAETRLFAIKNSFLDAGVSPAAVDAAMVYWRRHLDAVAAGNAEELQAVFDDAQSFDDGYRGQLLPPAPDELPATGIYNSMGRDYTEELLSFDKPWFSIYGQADRVVPVDVSVANIERIRRSASNEGIEVRVIPGFGHSFRNTDSGEEYPFERDVLAWLMAQADIDIHASSGGHQGR